jgi:hypothetical protein
VPVLTPASATMFVVTRTTLQIRCKPAELERSKAGAAEAGITLTGVVRAGIEQKLAELEKTRRTEVLEPGLEEALAELGIDLG